MTNNTKQFNIPEKILTVLRELEQAGFEAFLVGGSVRDLIMSKEPKDWDITTNAKPKEILEVFPNGKYENQFGTVILPEKYIQVESQAREEVVPRGGANSDGRGGTSRSANEKNNHDQAFAGQESTNTKKEEQKNNTKNSESEIGNVEITTYRIESTYSDNRRPDEVKFAETLEEDLSRRDFTCNAIALRFNFKFKPSSRRSRILNFNSILNDEILNNPNKSWEKYGWKIIDLFGGVQDIQNQAIRAVGEADERFNEDALRMMRAVRFASQLSEGDDLDFLKNRKKEGHQNQKTEYQTLSQHKHSRWWIGERTFDAIKKNAHLLKHISPERISDEFQKIILSNRPAWGVELLVETGLMKYIIPEILDTISVRQNRHHYYGPFNTVYKHLLAALKTCPSEKLEVRLAAFFHDIGKPESKRGHGYKATFHGHEYISARKVKVIMERLKFPRKIIDKTVLLVKNHMFYYNTDEVGEKGVRKVIRKVGLDNINDLIDVRIGDRLGSGVAKAVPYKLRHFKYMVEKVSKDPISVKDLKINGDILLAEYNFKPGPQMGAILEILLAEVLDDPKLNTIEHLSQRALELQKEDLQQLRQIAKDKIKEEKQKEEQQTKGKYWVK
jgi:tRNA nucleotidyltransferase/poly(A) polymerase